MSKTIFLTGATGGIGRELVRRFLEKTEHRLFLLVRPKNSDSHRERIEKLFQKMGINGNFKSRVRVFSGDVTEPGFGLSPEEGEEVTRQADEFFHIAALTHLGAEWEEAEKINLQGTVHALELAVRARERGRLQRFIYFSTAYVAGSFTPVRSLEDELPGDPSFANNYEATKYLAEKKVREESDRGLSTLIFRPSIVVGDSRTGVVSEFNVIYPFWRLFAHGLLKKLPSKPDHAFNIVPMDFVVDASFHISQQPEAAGSAYHLVSEGPPTLKMLLEVKDESGITSPVEVIDPEKFSVEALGLVEREIFSKINPYLGYLNSSLTFDTANAHRALDSAGISFPNTDKEFLKKLLGYAIESGYILKQ